MSPVAVAVTPTSWCRCELPCLPACVQSVIQTAVWGPPSSYPPFIHAGKMGTEKLDPPGAVCSNHPHPSKVWPWRPPETIIHLSETEQVTSQLSSI